MLEPVRCSWACYVMRCHRLASSPDECRLCCAGRANWHSKAGGSQRLLEGEASRLCLHAMLSTIRIAFIASPAPVMPGIHIHFMHHAVVNQFTTKTFEQSPVLNVCSQLTSKATGLLLVVDNDASN